VVVRVRDHYALVLRSGNETHVTWIDRAGVRLDDTTAARLVAHVPAWGIPVAVLVLLMTPLLLLVAAPGLARQPPAAPGAHARAWWFVVALTPASLAMLAAALLAWW
jgi:hypothetical protein